MQPQKKRDRTFDTRMFCVVNVHQSSIHALHGVEASKVSTLYSI